MSRWSQPETKNLAAQLRQSEKPAERSLDCKCPTLTSQFPTKRSAVGGQIRAKTSRLQNDRCMWLAYVVVGVLSLFALAIYLLYFRHLKGMWRTFFVICAVISLYFNVFILVEQHFQKVPALFEIAPTPTYPAFAITQTVVLVVFILLGAVATKRFQDGPSV